MKIVIDTNIVFSALLNSSSRISQILLGAPRDCFSFYSCSFLQTEILKHFNKLQKYTKLDNIQLFELIQIIMRRITFIDDKLLPKEIILKAEELTKGIDSDDTPFVASAEYLNAVLWTGDKELIHGFQIKEYRNFKTTADMLKLFELYKKSNP